MSNEQYLDCHCGKRRYEAPYTECLWCAHKQLKRENEKLKKTVDWDIHNALAEVADLECVNKELQRENEEMKIELSATKNIRDMLQADKEQLERALLENNRGLTLTAHDVEIITGTVDEYNNELEVE